MSAGTDAVLEQRLPALDLSALLVSAGVGGGHSGSQECSVRQLPQPYRHGGGVVVWHL
jgi:hypothetical protein